MFVIVLQPCERILINNISGSTVVNHKHEICVVYFNVRLRNVHAMYFWVFAKFIIFALQRVQPFFRLGT